MNFAGCIPRFLKAHGSLILTILSGFGLVATVVETAIVAPDARDAVDDAQDEKFNALMKKVRNGDETKSRYDVFHEVHENEDWRLTFWERVDAAGPHYIPVILLGLGTMACMAGAHILSVKQQASLLAAYGLLQKQFSAYRGEIREKYGEEADHEAYILSQKRIECLQNEVEQLKKMKGYATFGIATIPGLIFRANMAQIENGFLHFNRNLMLRGYGCVKELHEMIGLPVDSPMISPPTSPDEDYGWNELMNQVNYEGSMIDFQMEDVVARDGEIVHVIIPSVPPYRLDVDGEYDLQRYEQYDIASAIELARYGFADAPMRAEVDPEHYCSNPGGIFA